MQPTIYSVKEFNELINTVLQETVGEVTVSGEISNFQVRQNKWISFDLKDSDSVLNCFMPVYQIDMPLADGQAALVTGTPRIYVPYGKYSFNVRTVELQGEGALKKAFEKLKAKLEAEGLFSPTHKRPLPHFPETIGIITSGEGAAVNDILKVINGRWGGLKLYLAPVLVQGKNAPDELVGALDYFNKQHPVDVIILGRGGGSLEDLQAFNSERVARAIFSSRIPIVAGIGHEHNTSIADLVVDVRAATPSNAAELTVTDRAAMDHELRLLREQAKQHISHRFMHVRRQMSHHTHALQLFISARLGQVHLLIQQVHYGFMAMEQTISRFKEDLVPRRIQLTHAMALQIRRATDEMSEEKRLLLALNPSAILERGYSITYQKTTFKPILSLTDLPSDGLIRTQVKQGVFDSYILSRSKKTPEKTSPTTKKTKPLTSLSLPQTEQSTLF